MQFGLRAILRHSNTPTRNASRSDAGGPSLRLTEFEDEDDDEDEYEAPCEGRSMHVNNGRTAICRAARSTEIARLSLIPSVRTTYIPTFSYHFRLSLSNFAVLIVRHEFV